MHRYLMGNSMPNRAGDMMAEMPVAAPVVKSSRRSFSVSSHRSHSTNATCTSAPKKPNTNTTLQQRLRRFSRTRRAANNNRGGGDGYADSMTSKSDSTLRLSTKTSSLVSSVVGEAGNMSLETKSSATENDDPALAASPLESTNATTTPATTATGSKCPGTTGALERPMTATATTTTTTSTTPPPSLLSQIASRQQLLLQQQRRPKKLLTFELKKHECCELGYMNFCHDSLHDALDDAARCGKPALCIEAEIPGDACSGREVFSHPLLVEAASALFCTVHPTDALYSAGNRRSATGKSKRTVVSIYEGNTGTEILPSLSADALTRGELAQAMIRALQIHNKSSGGGHGGNNDPNRVRVPIPKYLHLVKEEEMGRLEICGRDGDRRIVEHRALFGVKDSALGEVEFAGLDGVLATKSGFIDRKPIVDVTYDAKRLPYCCLVRYSLKRRVGGLIYYQSNEQRIAAQVEVARVRGGESTSLLAEFQGTIQLAYNPKPALRKTPMRFVPLTELQATRANRLIHLGRFDEAMHLLSPRQGLILMHAMHHHGQKYFRDAIEVPILPAWEGVCDTMNKSNDDDDNENRKKKNQRDSSRRRDDCRDHNTFRISL